MITSDVDRERWRPIDEAIPLRRPKLFAIDIDHTLIRTDHTLAAATREAVDHVRRRGADVVLASSRPPRAMWPYLRDLGLVGTEQFVSLQGALIGRYTDRGALSIESSVAMGLESAKRVVELAAAEGLAVNWYRDESWLVSRVDAGVEHEAAVVHMTPETRELQGERDAPQKLLLIDSDPAGTAMRRVLAGLPSDLLATHSNPSYLEVTASGVDKGAAVSEIAASLGVEREEVVAIGDGPNDLGMFAIAGLTVAPANAAPAVRAVAGYRTRSNDEDGVALALRTLLP